MTLNPANRQGLSPIDTKVLSNIETYGWNVMTVAPRVGEDGDLWAYSTGLFYSLGHPEIILFNLKLESMQTIINIIGNQVKSGKKFEAGNAYDGIIDNYQAAFREVRRGHFNEYVGFSLWFYESSNFPMIQCFWPDKNHRFPWDAEAPDWLQKSQPLLYRLPGNPKPN